MGICASCMGRRRDDTFDEDDVSRLLDDPNNFQYGSFDPNVNAQGDPLESQRETEALQRVVARTSNNLVDVFDIIPQENQHAGSAMFSAQDPRLIRYQDILSKLSMNDEAAQGQQDWLSEEDLEAQADTPGIKGGSGEPLVGTFADAAA